MKKIKEILQLKSKNTTLLLGTFLPFFVSHVVSYTFAEKEKKNLKDPSKKAPYVFLYICAFIVTTIFPMTIGVGFVSLIRNEYSFIACLSFLLFGLFCFLMATGACYYSNKQ